MNYDEWNRLKIQFKSLKPSWKTLAVISFDIIILVLSILLVASGKFFSFAIGIILLTWFLLHVYLFLHEASHSAVSTNRRLNNLTGHICGWLILMPYLTRQRSHLLHHAWTGHPKGDPANQRLIQKFTVLTQDQASRLEWIWKSWIPLFAINDRIGLWLDSFQQRKNGVHSSRIKREIKANYCYIIGYGLLFIFLLATGNLIQFLACSLPAMIFLFFLEELANAPHHAETPLLNEADKALPYWEQYKVTHSCKTVPIWSRFVLLNFNLHIAHHMFPWVPSSHLPEVHCEIIQKLSQFDMLQQTTNEIEWSIINRKRPLLEIMGHYFDKISKQANVL